MQAIIEGNLYEIEPAVKVILDRVMTENAELKRLEESHQKAIRADEVVAILRDYGLKDISILRYILDQYQKVIANITNGRMSCLAYPAETILSVVSDIYNEDLEKAIAEIDELEAENARLEEAFQKATGVIAATDCAEHKEYIDDVNSAIDCIKHFCRKQRSCVDCPIYAGNEYYTCLFRDGIAPAHWGNVEIINCNEEASGGADNETD